MRALILGPEEKANLQAAYERARAKPIPWEILKRSAAPEQNVPVLTLDNRPDVERPDSQCVEIPMGYMVCVSFEEQPAGILAHFSVSVAKKDALPHTAALKMIIDEFGFDISKADMAWIEEFTLNNQPGGMAANYLFMVEPREGPETQQ